MPLGRYFAFAGSLVIALLFLADWYIPRPSAASDGTDVERSIIRIQTMHRWPDAIVFDPSLATISPPSVIAAGFPAARAPRDALAAAADVAGCARFYAGDRGKAGGDETPIEDPARSYQAYRKLSGNRPGDVFLPGWQAGRSLHDRPARIQDIKKPPKVFGGFSMSVPVSDYSIT